MKKLFKILFGLIGTILLLIIVAVVVVVILLYDTTNNMNQDIIDADKSSTEVIQDATYDALETTKDDNSTLSFGFTEYSMNELLYSLTKGLSEQIQVLEIKGVYSEYNEDGSFTLNAPLELYSFKSRLSAKIKVKDTNESISLTLSDLKLGKISSSNFIIKKIIDEALDPQIIEDAINDNSDIDVDVTYDDGKLSLSIMNNDFFSLIQDNFADDGELGGMVSTLVDVAKNNPDLYDVSFDSNIKGFKINLSYLESEVDSDYSFEVRCNMDKDENSVVANVETLLKASTITEDQLNAVINYLVRGYDALESNEQVIIDAVDLSSIGISNSDKKTHKGIVERDDGDLSEYIENNMPTLSISNPEAEIKISNKQLNALVDDEAFIGTTTAFTNTNLDVNYITIGNVYIKTSVGTINDTDTTEYGKLDAFVIIDLNGKEIQAHLALHTVTAGSNYKLTTYLDSINMGNITLTSDQAFSIFSDLNDMLGIEGFMTLNTVDRSILLDFTEYFAASPTAVAADDLGITNTLSIKEDENGGYISVFYSL